MSDQQEQSPPSALTVQAVPQKQFPVQHSDWLKIRRRVANLKEPVPYLASVGWTCVGITTAASLALLPWFSVDSALPAKVRAHYTYMTPLLIMIAIAGAVIAIFTFVVGHKIRQMRVTMIENVLVDMDAIYEPYRHAQSGPAASI